MHENVAAEDEGVRVDLSDDAATTGSGVSKDAVGLCVLTKRFEVEIVDRWVLRFVKRGTRTGNVLNV